LTDKTKKFLKTSVGFAVSLFFLWVAFRNTSFKALLSVPLPHPQWLLFGLAFLAIGYLLRSYRWWTMLNASSRVPFSSAVLVLLTSFGANNIYPLRLGDVLRVFFYSKELKTHSSVVLSTVVLERILDLFALLALLLLAIEGSTTFPYPKAKTWAGVMLTAATVGMIAMVIVAELSGPALQRRIDTLADEGFAGKIKRSLAGALDSIRKIGLVTMLLLMLESLVIWLCEGMVFVSASKALALAVQWIAPWQALVLANLSTLLPSTPGYVGTFDYAAKLALTTKGVSQSTAGFYALLVHAMVWIPITSAGGISALILRSRRSKPDIDENVVPLGEPVS
jgi:uncharacterized protein (TIRG00374 family)